MEKSSEKPVVSDHEQTLWDRLWKSKGSDESAIEDLLQEFSWLPHNIIKYLPNEPHPELRKELLNVCKSAMFERMQTYTPKIARDLGFVGYSLRFIRGRVLQYIKDTSQLPRGTIDEQERLTKLQEEFFREHKRLPSYEELSEYTRGTYQFVGTRRVEMLLDILKGGLLSFDKPIGTEDPESRTLHDKTPSECFQTPYQEIEWRDIYLTLHLAVEFLKSKLKYLIRAHYWNGKQIKELAKGWGVSVPTVNKWHRKALCDLRETLEGQNIMNPFEGERQRRVLKGIRQKRGGNEGKGSRGVYTMWEAVAQVGRKQHYVGRYPTQGEAYRAQQKYLDELERESCKIRCNP